MALMEWKCGMCRHWSPARFKSRCQRCGAEKGSGHQQESSAMTTIPDVDRLHSMGLYAPGDPPGPVDDSRCGRCGCTDNNACWDEYEAQPCYFMDDYTAQQAGFSALCSRCYWVLLGVSVGTDG